ncbi:8-amino-7-oxononanoate synthase [Thermogutta sp.]|uniref:8-amino-7-oxononanoate synthase n=1 Tax=Thermogutta sp. TaxID=1962930 RepID=UPI003C7CD050
MEGRPQWKVDVLGWLTESLEELDRQSLRRTRRCRTSSQGRTIWLDGRELLNFGSNDYLGLASDPRLITAVRNSLEKEGWGSGASALVCGRSSAHAALEEALAKFEGCEAALLFPTGFAANVGTIAALVGPGDAVYCDRKNHASIIDGCKLSRADLRVFPHADVDTLDQLLAKPHRHRRRLVVTDTLFSMDGDLAPIAQLVEVCERHGVILMVDEAHATGVFGKRGRGVVEFYGVEDRVPVRVGTLSKAMGSVGGFVVGSTHLVEWLVQKARPYMFSTALPGAACYAAMAALEIIEREPHRREVVLERAEFLREVLRREAWDVGRSTSQIIPVIVHQPETALLLSRFLESRGFFVPAIRPPAVPDNEACLRISVTFHHQTSDLQRLVETLGEARRRLGLGDT